MSGKEKAIAFFKSTGGRIVLTIGIYALTLLFMSLFGMLTDYMPNSNVSEIVMTVFSLIVVAVWAFYGWRALSFITPNIFLIMPLAGWVFYFVVKGILSIVVGIFVGPYYISKEISNIIDNKY